MALVKPIINEISAFDATIGTTITFTANGGDQVTGNEIKIVSNNFIQGYFNSENNLFYSDDTLTTPIVGNTTTIYIGLNTNDNYIYNGVYFVVTSLTEIVVYQNTVSTYNLFQTIPPNVLTNGEYYRAAIRTYDVLNNVSIWSNYQPFYCFSTPTLLLNVISGQVVTASSYNVVLSYNQTENEKVDYAIIELFNNDHVLLNSSGNLYNSNFPPLEFNYTVFGLENHTQYYVKGTVVTLYGTIIQTDSIPFYTNYDTEPAKTRLDVTLDNCNGYVNLHSTMTNKIVGVSNPNPLEYINNEEGIVYNSVADINNDLSSYVKADNNLFIATTDFLLRVWFYPARQPFECIKLFNYDRSSYLTVSLKRGSTQDYLSLRTDNGTKIDRALGDFCNGHTKIFLWCKVIDDVWDVQVGVLSTEATILNWNDNTNNLSYNVTSDITYVGESYETFTPSSDVCNTLSSNFTNFILGNGIFDHFNLTSDTSIIYSTTKPTDWTDETILNINFNGNLVASQNYTKLVLKRKDSTLLSWINLSEINIIPNVPTFVDFNDSFIPTGVTQDYALVVYLDDVPSEYITQQATPTWGKYFLSDKNNRFVLNYAVLYSGHVQNIQNGVFMPIGSTYPIVVQNGEGNYRSGSLQFKVLGYQFEEDKRLDRVSMTKQLDDILKFLTNGKAKCLTDFNGNIFILKVINSPQISYDGNWGNSIPTVSFDWVEQGKYNDYNSMLELGLFDYIATE